MWVCCSVKMVGIVISPNASALAGPSYDPNGMALLLGYREDGETPFLISLKDGVIEEKC